VLAAAQTSILSIGSGDGSQQAAIVRAGHLNICVTFHDSRAGVLAKFPAARDTLALFEQKGVEHHFSVDAASIGTGGALDGGRKFDVVLFYFPHVGGDTAQPEVLKANRQLVRSYLAGASRVLAQGGEIQLAVKMDRTYAAWNVHDLFGEQQLHATHQQPVDKSQFPGYVHRLTKGANSKQRSVPDVGAQLYVLQLAESEDADEPLGSLVALGAQICVIAEGVTSGAPTDDALGPMLLKALASVPAGQKPTVLDLRSTIGKALGPVTLPETQQLNRVLYELEAEGRVHRGAALENGRKSSKPTWSLLDSPAWHETLPPEACQLNRPCFTNYGRGWRGLLPYVENGRAVLGRCDASLETWAASRGVPSTRHTQGGGGGGYSRD